MEDKNGSKDLYGAPILQSDNKLYNCSKCASVIEILSINENEIKFKCKEHELKMKIKNYLDEMIKHKDEKLNDKICNTHNKEYYSYCFDCNLHLCKECISSKKHNYHYKIYLEEITPDNEILIKIQEKIKENEINKNELNKKKIENENKLSKIKENNINKIIKIIEKRIEINNCKEKEQIKLNKNNLKENIEKLKKEYENKIKEIKLKNELEINKIKKITN